jgi:hypothetical protein
MRRPIVRVVLSGAVVALAFLAAQSAFAGVPPGYQCTKPGLSYMCVDVGTPGPPGWDNYPFWNLGVHGYVGHDEPSLLFYSNHAGAGNNNTWQITLPKDPAAMPTQGQPNPTWGFQEHPAFWFGMAMCDSLSYPQYTTTCNPDTDANIFDDASSTSPGFIGHHPGTAFMEMQFYPPGWIPQPNGNGCGATTWCAALNIDSLAENGATGAFGGPCAAIGYPEYINFAYITRNGVPTASPSPLDLGNQFNLTPGILYMHGGDRLVVVQRDTFSGLEIQINDTTSGQSGFMIASGANGFQQMTNACAGINYNFHPMYATSSIHTRVPWAAHSYNVAFSDEIGHFNFCNGAPNPGIFFSACPGGYTEGGTDDTPEPADPAGPGGDQNFCVDGSYSALVNVNGCVDSNAGFDGSPYSLSSWPGNGNDQNTPQPIVFKSPYINGSPFLTFSQVGFEADLPRVEVPNPANPNLACNRYTGVGCTNPPLTDDPVAPPNNSAAQFYPIFTTGVATGKLGACQWREGGPSLPQTLDTFGGNSTTEYGPLESVLYQTGAATAGSRYNDFRQIVNNPCQR